MHALAERNITEKQYKSLIRRKYVSAENYLRTPPKTFHPYDRVMPLDKRLNGKDVAVAGLLESVGTSRNTGRVIVTAKIRDFATGKKLNINLIGQYQMFAEMKKWGKGAVVLAGGKLEYHDPADSFSMLNPYVLTNNAVKGMERLPDYGTMKDFEREDILRLHKECLGLKYDEFIPPYILQKYGILSVSRFFEGLHNPESESEHEKAKYRIKFEHMLYFALKMEQNIRRSPRDTVIRIKDTKMADLYIKNLPYCLTSDQKETYDSMKEVLKSGKRLNALVQGDVGSGKTTVAFMAMFLMADAGYQSVLMAPTCVLARQHYEELSGHASKLGLRTAFLGGKQTQKERKEILKGIKNGDYAFIVGTHGVFSEGVEYHSLGLSITDEEHRFGVLQRNSVMDKISYEKIHTVTMSATPIPRTIAQTLYGETTEVYTISSKPVGRQPVETTIFSKPAGILKFAEKQVQEGHQVYVVCPLIKKNEESGASHLKTVEEAYKEYSLYFNNKKINGKPVTVEYITGKMSEEETKKRLDAFTGNKCQILIATTIVEVGVNVPNATLIVINNAERFGMASLHQLRGRVGRGNNKSYCILNSDCIQNGDNKAVERLKSICGTNDGFEIALSDLRQRGTGDLFGEKQSGKNIYIDLMLEDKLLYKKLRKEASELCDSGTETDFIEKYEEIYNIGEENLS